MNEIFECDREPIHIPGRIQNSGFLLAFSIQEQTIAYVSENITAYIGLSPREVLLQNFSSFLHHNFSATHAEEVVRLLADHQENGKSIRNLHTKVEIKGRHFVIVLNENGHFVTAEFEIHDSSTDTTENFLAESLTSMVAHKSVMEQAAFLCDTVRNQSGFERVMMYKFDADYNGEVIAESIVPGIHSFLHHHFPASDIPPQARELYLKNLMRIIADVGDGGSALLSAPAFASEPLDLTHAVLRSVSPVHIQYLSNMAVKASFSISIVSNNRLWGLIACHGFSPRLVSFNKRTDLLTLAQVFSGNIVLLDQLASIRRAEKYSLGLRDVIKTLAVTGNAKDVVNFKLNEATGSAYFSKQGIKVSGQVPSNEIIRAIAENIGRLSNNNSVFYTNNLQETLELPDDENELASGVMGIVLDDQSVLLWFKPEHVTEIKWAGNPEKIITQYQGKTTLNPRTSFLAWSQIVTGRSLPWNDGEIATAQILYDEIKSINFLQAREIIELNQKLKQANDELFNFSYTVTHDLKTPLTGIINYTDLVLYADKGLSNESTGYLNAVIRNAHRMNRFINDIFQYTRTEFAEVEKVVVDVRPIIEKILEENKVVYPQVHVQVKNLEKVEGNEALLYQLFANVIGNAVKYCSKRQDPLVSIDANETQDSIIYSVADNGVGIPEKELGNLFKHFSRMSNVQGYEGTGLGLAIARRIADKHQARIWYESKEGSGSTCFIEFPCQDA